MKESLVYVTKLPADPVLIRIVSERGPAEYMKHSESLLLIECGLDSLKEIEDLEGK